MPVPRNKEKEISGEVWCAVGPSGVFSETFAPFLLGNDAVRAANMQHHADLLDAACRQTQKARIMAGDVHDVAPDEAGKRFRQPLSAVP